LIERADVFALRNDDVIELFLATMAWGYGRGWGWYRTGKIIELATADTHTGLEPLIERLTRVVHLAHSDRDSDLFDAWSVATNRARLRRFGPAFASKFAYFAGYNRVTKAGPLIADGWVAWALWALADVWNVRTDGHKYAEYLNIARRWADYCSRRPDEIERALFVLGPHIRKAWLRRDVSTS
jgi:glutathione S-transferase